MGIIVGAVIGATISWWVYNRKKKTSQMQDVLLNRLKDLEESHDRLLKKIEKIDLKHEATLDKLLDLDTKIRDAMASREKV
ncbi:MAG TPA: hypothetical protein VHA09_09270 [Nitrososphaera sp.]|nr:hypothetical protein [Nitrososphaera sp.]